MKLTLLACSFLLSQMALAQLYPSSEEYTLLDNIWVLTFKDERFYNNHCCQTGLERYTYNENFFPLQEFNSRAIYERATDCTIQKVTWFVYDPGDTTTVYYYTDTTVIEDNYQDNVVVKTTHYIYTYLAGQNIVSAIDCPAGICGDTIYRATHTYDMDGHLVHTVNEKNSTGQWNAFYTNFYEYDGDDLTSMTLNSNDDLNGGEIIGSWKEEYTYDGNHNELSRYSYTMDMLTSSWINDARTLSVYDNGMLVHDLKQIADDQTCCDYIDYYERDYLYDNGDLVEMDGHAFPWGEETDRYKITYYTHHDCTTIGDFNLDGMVNNDDLLLFVENFGCISCDDYDLDDDSVVGVTDLGILMGVME